MRSSRVFPRLPLPLASHRTSDGNREAGIDVTLRAQAPEPVQVSPVSPPVFLVQDPVQNPTLTPSCQIWFSATRDGSVLSLSLAFMTPTVLKSPGQFFHRMPFNLGLSFVFYNSIEVMRFGGGQELLQNDVMPFSVRHYQGVLLKVYIRSCQAPSVSLHISGSKIQTLLRSGRI